MTFYGQSTHQLDPKGRLCLPKRVHALVGKDENGERTVWLTRGKGGCVWLFTPDAFQERVDQLASDPFGNEKAVAAEREFWASTFQTKLDNSNRVLLPDELRELAGIAPSSEVVVIGMSRRVELWSKERRESKRLAPEEYDQVAQAFSSGGGRKAAEVAEQMQAQAFQALLQQQQMQFLKNLGLFGPGAQLPGAEADPPREGGR
ncbi:MAG: hypothetical protein R3F34_16850 [Planctomycetota bacterium]